MVSLIGISRVNPDARWFDDPQFTSDRPLPCESEETTQSIAEYIARRRPIESKNGDAGTLARRKVQSVAEIMIELD